MIVRLTGTVAEVLQESVVIDRDGVGYEVLVPGYALGELAACAGQVVTLHTMEYYEGTAAGGNLIPRIVGFLHAEDRAFFARFITVKGIGVRKAIKALGEPVAAVAGYIEAGNSPALARLPGIGARAAEQIVAELRGKVTAFAAGAAAGSGRAEPERVHQWTPAQRDALEVLVALGERRIEAERWLERAAQLHPDAAEADEWVRAAYRVKTGAQG
jgi:Holliday junction DNA helicase RuvA